MTRQDDSVDVLRMPVDVVISTAAVEKPAFPFQPLPDSAYSCLNGEAADVRRYFTASMS